MDTTTKILNKIARQIYEWGLSTDTSNRYDLPTDIIIDLVNKSS